MLNVQFIHNKYLFKRWQITYLFFFILRIHFNRMFSVCLRFLFPHIWTIFITNAHTCEINVIEIE